MLSLKQFLFIVLPSFTISVSFFGCSENNRELPSLESASPQEIQSYLQTVMKNSTDQRSVEVDNNFNALTKHFFLKIANQLHENKDISSSDFKYLMNTYESADSEISQIIQYTMNDKRINNISFIENQKYLTSVKGFSKSLANTFCDPTNVFLLKPRNFNLQKAESITKAFNIFYTLNSCQDKVSEYIKPLETFLAKKAIIQDIDNFIATFDEQKLSKQATLVTAKKEVTLDVKNTQERHYDFFKDLKFIGDLEFTRKSELTANVNATIAAGVDLSIYKIEAKHNDKLIIVHLKNPKITLSDPIVSFKEASSEIGAPEIDSNSYNLLQEKVRRTILQETNNTDLLMEARNNTQEFIISLFQPFLNLSELSYKVEVYFDEEQATHKDIISKDTAI